MPGMSALSVEEARDLNPDLIELKVDGSRITYNGSALMSDRDVDRSTRYQHVFEELEQINWTVRGEMAIPGGNILQLNKRVNWHRAKFFIFDLYTYNGKEVKGTPHQKRIMLEKILAKHNFKNVTLPKKFGSFAMGWKHVLEHDAEGLVLKDKYGFCNKVKLLKEEKLPIVGHVPGKAKGAFLIDREGIISKVSGTSTTFLDAYKLLKRRGAEIFAEIEYAFLTDDGTPYQPRLRRLGTMDDLSTT